ncbi:hypothetical protein BGW41_008385 [Actinomortierella wolfii]|nr:hypothetical protein BGW41_008385 [Actinomortierella wolfii]
MEKATIVATYSVADSATAQTSNDIPSGTSESTTLTFQETFSFDATGSSTDVSKKHLDSLASALKTLQATINTGLTDRLVATGVLSAEEPGEKKKIRTKVAGQQTGKKENKNNKDACAQDSTEASAASRTSSTFSPVTLAAEPAATQEPALAVVEDMSSDDVSSMDIDQQVASKKAFGDNDEDQEDDKDKDEVDLVMEADPGEVDGACLELPKETDLANTIKRQSESAVDGGSQTSKKAKGE